MKVFIKALVISGSIALLANLSVAKAETTTGEGTRSCPLNQVNPSYQKKNIVTDVEESKDSTNVKARSADGHSSRFPRSRP